MKKPIENKTGYKMKKTEKIQYEETIEELLEEKKKDRKTKIILIIIIILLLLIFWLVGYRMGRIGYGVKDVVANPDETTNNVTAIKVMQGDLQITKDTRVRYI